LKLDGLRRFTYVTGGVTKDDYRLKSPSPVMRYGPLRTKRNASVDKLSCYFGLIAHEEL
jgi:hypothetical protein